MYYEKRFGSVCVAVALPSEEGCDPNSDKHIGVKDWSIEKACTKSSRQIVTLSTRLATRCLVIHL